MKNFVIFGLKFIGTYIVLLVVFYWTGPFFYKSLLPIWRFEINQSRFYKVGSADIKNIADSKSLSFNIKISIPILLKHRDQVITAKGEQEVNLPLGCLSNYFILSFSLLAAWPGISWRQKVKPAIIAVGLILLTCLIDVPVLVIGFLEGAHLRHPQADDFTLLHFNRLFHYVANYGQWLLVNGGRQVLAIIIFAISLLPYYFPKKNASEMPTSRNAPCPCGSGRKFKHCCLRLAK